jgi:hypothetical protein
MSVVDMQSLPIQILLCQGAFRVLVVCVSQAKLLHHAGYQADPPHNQWDEDLGC